MDRTQLPSLEHFGERLKYVFEHMGLEPSRGVEALSQHFRWPVDEVSGWLGDAESPLISRVVELAKWAKVDAHWLASGDNEPMYITRKQVDEPVAAGSDSADRESNEMWRLACACAGVEPDASIDKVHEAFGGSVGRGTIQRIREGGTPHLASLQRMADHLGIGVDRMIPQSVSPVADSPMQAAIANFVRSCRNASGLSQAAFGELYGVKQPAVSWWERGDGPPDFETMAAMASRHGIKLPGYVYDPAAGSNLDDALHAGVGRLLAEARQVMPAAVLDSMTAPANTADFVRFLNGLAEMTKKASR